MDFVVGFLGWGGGGFGGEEIEKHLVLFGKAQRKACLLLLHRSASSLGLLSLKHT